MAGRRAHIGNDRFGEFFESIPEESKGQGYWRVKKENYAEHGGVVQSFLGFIPFNAQESYESLKARIKDQFAMVKGPGTYYAIPCDDRKRELKDVDMVKIELTEKEVPVPTPGESGSNGASATDPIKDTLNTFKRTQKDMAEFQALKVQQKLMKQLVGDDDEEDSVKESAGMMGGGGIENLLLYRSLFENKDEKKGGSIDASAIKEIIDDKLDRKLHDLKEALKPKQEDSEMKILLRQLVENQKPKEDSDVKKLLEVLVTKNAEKEKESTLQTMFAMQIKQQEERDRIREAQEKAKEEERREERRRFEEQSRLDREKWERESREREERWKGEMELRKAELKAAQEGSKATLSEQQQMQLKFFDIMKDGKNSNFEVMKDVFGLMTNSGLTSMKTAQQAAEAIVSIAQKVDSGKDKEEAPSNTIVELLKGLGSIAGPVLGQMAGGDAQMKMLQQIASMAGGGGGIDKLLAGMGQPQRVEVPRPPAPPKHRPQVQEMPAAAPSAEPKVSQQKDGGMAMVIVGMLQKYPEIKITMIGNMQDKLGVDMFIDMLYEFDLPGVDKMIAMMPTKFLMDCVKQVCDAEEKKIIDANVQWFADLKRIMLEEVRKDAEEDDAEDEMQDAIKKVATAPKVEAPAPVPAAAPASPAAPAPQA